MYTDFSWLHVHRIPDSVTNGYVYRVSCAKEWLDIPLDAGSNCVSSMILVFRDDERKVPYCMLEKYEYSAGSCLSTNISGSEAKRCIQTELDDCFRSHGVVNDLLETSVSSPTPQSSRVLVDDIVANRDEFRDESSMGVVLSFRGNDTLFQEVLLTGATTSRWDVVPVTKRDQSQDRIASAILNRWVHVVWLGFTLSYDGDWYTLNPGCALANISVFADKSHKLKTKVADFIKNQSFNVRNCLQRIIPTTRRDYKYYPRYLLAYLKTGGNPIKEFGRWITPSNVRLSNDTTKVVFMSKSSYRRSNRVRAWLSTSPSFVIPGFMKAGTTFIYNLIADHPQTLPNLAGSQFKETGCYDTKHLSLGAAQDRMLCFPFVKSNEGFIFGDASVTYAGFYNTPIFMKKENPNLKVIFVTRDPVDRLHSHHRFMYKSFQDQVNGIGGINHQIRDMLLNKSKELLLC